MIEYTTLIGTVGFPIVAFFLMYDLVKKTIKENTSAIIELKNAILKSRKWN